MITLEAESGTVTSPMTVRQDPAASGGAYVVQTTRSGTGATTLRFSVPSAGDYRLGGRVIAPSGSANSLTWAVDGGTARPWVFEDDLRSWTWETDVTVPLTRGTHTLVVRHREAGTRLDAVRLTPAAP